MQLYLEPLTACPRLPRSQRPGLFQPGGARASFGPRLSSGVAATGRRVRTPGRGPKAVVEPWAPRALTPLPVRCPSTAGAASVSVGATWSQSQRARVFLTGRCSGGARCWGRGVHVGRGGSAGVKSSLLLGCARVMGAHSSGILFAGRRQRLLTGLVLFPKDFWRIGYKG